MPRYKKSRKAASNASLDDEAEQIKAKKEEILKTFDDKVKEEIRKLEDAAQAVETAIKAEMRSVLMSIPKDVAKMTVKEYIKQYLAEAEATDQNQSADASFEEEPICTDFLPNHRNNTRQPASSLQTPMPSRSNFNLKVEQGTPLITNTCVRKPTGVPRAAKETDKIGTIELKLFSERGSPMLLAGDQMSTEMRRKMAEAFANAAQECMEG